MAFDLTGKVALVTGGAGFMGPRHARALVDQGCRVALADLPAMDCEALGARLAGEWQADIVGYSADVTRKEQVERLHAAILADLGPVDILVNNAANNPVVTADGLKAGSRFETLALDVWEGDLTVTLTGAFLCCQVFGAEMAGRGKGVILNVASDLAVIAPDQRLYRLAGVAEDQQPVKPVTYSVAKTGLIGLTRYLATYWAPQGVRVNAISPGGVSNHQPEEFVQRLTALVPMGRMAQPDEWAGAIQFLCSDASSYITGINLVIDGGRSVW